MNTLRGQRRRATYADGAGNAAGVASQSDIDVAEFRAESSLCYTDQRSVGLHDVLSYKESK